jgi:CRISPR type I-E-associated protein CasB/Cse2
MSDEAMPTETASETSPPSPPPNPREAAAQKLVLSILRECQSGQKRSMLRRAVGASFHEARNVSWFYRLLAENGIGQKDGKDDLREELAFLLATLIAQDRERIQRCGEGAKAPALLGGLPNLGATLSALEKSDDPTAYEARTKLRADPDRRESRYERRFRLLLDAELLPDGSGELPFRLRQCVRIIHQKDGLIRWPQLYRDLCDWHFANKPAQKRWAREFYGIAANDPEAGRQMPEAPDDTDVDDLTTDLPE